MDSDSVILPYQFSACAGTKSLPVLFASPHSGQIYPQTWVQNSRLNAQDLRRSEDMFVNELFSNMPELGAALLSATVARAYVDLNRSRSELDPILIKDVQGQQNNLRVQSGLGVIPRVVGPKLDIHRRQLSWDEAEERLRAVWDPYHDQLQDRMHELPDELGFRVLVDCHSMPQAALEMSGLQDLEINLGTLAGRSCAPWVVQELENALRANGFVVGRNLPYAGAYIMSAYGQPKKGMHAIQIEIARRLYMDEEGLVKTAEFGVLKARLTQSMAQFLTVCEAHAGLF